MDIPSFIVVFVCTWWIVFFMALPFGVQRDEGGPETTSPGAPKVPHLKKKAIITTLISLVICVMIGIAIQAEWISFREIAKSMAQEDYQ